MLMTITPTQSEIAVERLISETLMPVWCAVYTAIGCERKAQMAIEELGYGTFLPTYKKAIAFQQRRSARERPLLSRYVLFARSNNEDGWPRINEADGIERVLANNGRPIVFSDDDLKALRVLMIAHATGEYDDAEPAGRKKYAKYQKRRPRPRHNKTVRRVRAMLDKALAQQNREW